MLLPLCDASYRTGNTILNNNVAWLTFSTVEPRFDEVTGDWPNLFLNRGFVI